MAQRRARGLGRTRINKPVEAEVCCAGWGGAWGEIEVGAVRVLTSGQLVYVEARGEGGWRNVLTLEGGAGAMDRLAADWLAQRGLLGEGQDSPHESLRDLLTMR
jgi:hypothetical protein